MKLRTKFNLVVLVAFAAGFALTGVLLKQRFDSDAKEQVLQTARVMLAAANSARVYTTDKVRPVTGFEQNAKFVAISIPSFAAQATLRGLGADFADYRYKEAALNPTNPDDRAADWEADIINDFRAQSALKQVVLQRDTPTGTMMVVSRPLAVDDPSCLSCHSVPGAAPASMIAQYGTANGFGWTLNSIIGAQIVSLPLDSVINKSNENLGIFLGLLVGVFVVMLVILNLLLDYLVIRPAKRLSQIATQVSLGESDVEEFGIKGDDEISMLAAAFNRMRRSLASAMGLLGGADSSET